MILKVDIFFCFCVLSVNSAINITSTTEEREWIPLHQNRINFRDSESIYFKVKSCEEMFMNLILMDGSSGTVNNYPFYRVHFGRRYISRIEYPSESILDNTFWPQRYCGHYVSFWVSWICGTIEAGEGTKIGYYKFNNWFIVPTDVTDISIMSYTTADWEFDIPKNTSSDCTPDESAVGSESDPTIIRTTETTTPEFASTTISSTDTTTPEFASTTISSTDTTTPEFSSTTISSTDTTTQEFASTTISSTDTTTPEFASTTISSTHTTTPEFASTTISSTDTTTPEFASTTISSTDTTIPEFASTTISSTDTTTQEFASTTISSSDTTTPEIASTTKSSTHTTTPEFASTTISSTETTTPEFASTTISSTDTTPDLDLAGISTAETTTPGFDPTAKSSTVTTPELDLTGISTAETTTSGFDQTTKSTIISTSITTTRATPIAETTERSPTKTPCTCPCNNFTMTEDELITKIALLKSELSVDRKQTNKYRRSVTSASDNRPSSKYIGTFGIVVLVVICTLIVLMDLQHCACFMFHKKK